MKKVFLIVLVVGLWLQNAAAASVPPALRAKAISALSYCRTNNYNTKFCILIDLGAHSGLKRFYVWDFQKADIIHSALVSHGCGKMPWSWSTTADRAVLSNKDGSHCSAAGKYRIGKRGFSNWGIGINYQLHGLEASNSNAIKRQIVFHSWEKVGDSETYPQGTPEGWGCPAISNASMRIIDSKLKAAKKPVLMWIYQNES